MPAPTDAPREPVPQQPGRRPAMAPHPGLEAKLAAAATAAMAAWLAVFPHKWPDRGPRPAKLRRCPLCWAAVVAGDEPRHAAWHMATAGPGPAALEAEAAEARRIADHMVAAAAATAAPFPAEGPR